MVVAWQMTVDTVSVSKSQRGCRLLNEDDRPRRVLIAYIKIVRSLFKGKEVSHADFLSIIQVAMGIRDNHTDPG